MQMKKKQGNQPQQSFQMATYRFICQKQVQFGQAIYLSGNIKELGQWKPQNSLQLTCYQMKFWVLDAKLPIQTQIQFKYFISKDLGGQSPQSLSVSPTFWIGNEKDQNFTLFITKQEAKMIDHQRKTRDLKTMSFNIRNDNECDKNEYSWDIRKFNCVKVIKEHCPSIVGIQESTVSQRQYLQKSLQPFFNYVGFSDVKDCNQQVGIFYDKQRFILIECGFKFICETKKIQSPGSSTCPSLFSFVVLEDTYNSQRFHRTFNTSQDTSQSSKSISELPRQLFLVQNIYLNYHASKSQQECLDMITQEIKTKREQYKEEIRDIFILGDFNLPQNSHILRSLQKSDLKMESIRKNLLRRHMKESCDLGYTFNAFEHDQHDVENPQKIIDHLYVASTDYEPIKFEVVRSVMDKSSKHSKPQIISDHYPIMGVFRHKKNKSISQKAIH